MTCLVADTKANTALHVAAIGGHAAVCCRLVAAGADPLVRNTQAQHADDMARQHSHLRVCRVFKPTLSGTHPLLIQM